MPERTDVALRWRLGENTRAILQLVADGARPHLQEPEAECREPSRERAVDLQLARCGVSPPASFQRASVCSSDRYRETIPLAPVAASTSFIGAKESHPTIEH